MYLVCDWEDNVAHYNLPLQYRKRFEEMCSVVGIALVFCRTRDEWPDLHKIVAYVGNRPESEILHSTSLKWVHFGSVGTDRLDSRVASEQGVMITNSQGIFDNAVALHGLARVLNRLVPKCGLRAGSAFNRESWEESTTKADDAFFHVLGNGPIAQRLCIMLSSLGLSVRAYTRAPSKYDLPYEVVKYDQRSESNGGKSFVINLLPASEDTNRLVSASFLQKFGSIQYYLNIGRPNTESLDDIRALMLSGTIEYAGWDVLRDERICLALKSQFNDRVDFTPHVAAFTTDHWSASFELLKGNLSCFLSGDFASMQNRVNA